MRRAWCAGPAVVAAMLSASPGAARAEDAPLVLEAKIPLGAVGGRIDHLAIDLKRRRLFVAELGNDSLAIVDVAAGRVLRTVGGFAEPQGVGYDPAGDAVYVANAGDGSVRILRGEDLAPLGRLELGADADNIRVEPVQGRIVVGYGDGGLAVIDPHSRTVAARLPLAAHPEGFQIDNSGRRAFVNLPDARRIATVDLATGEAGPDLPTEGLRANFPMAIDRAANRLAVGFRNPPRLLVFAAGSGAVAARLDICGDADDIFADTRRDRLYVSCGAGAVEVFAGQGGGYRPLGRVATAPGARTALFVPELDRLFVAVRAAGRRPAAIWVYRPAS